MFGRPKKARASIETARAIIEDPKLRSAAAEAAQPMARLGVGVSSRVAQRKARRRLNDLDNSLDHLISALNAAAEQAASHTSEFARGLDQLKSLEVTTAKHRRRRTAPTMLAGGAVGAGLVLLLEPGQSGRARRRRARSLITRTSPSPSESEA